MSHPAGVCLNSDELRRNCFPLYRLPINSLYLGSLPGSKQADHMASTDKKTYALVQSIKTVTKPVIDKVAGMAEMEWCKLSNLQVGMQVWVGESIQNFKN
jgi:hypothetical protein